MRRHVHTPVRRGPHTLFAEAFEHYYASHAPGWSDTHCRQWRGSYEKHVREQLGSVAMGSIDVAAVLSVIQPIWHEHQPTAQRLRRRIAQVIAAHNVLAGTPGAPNPALWVGCMEHLLKATPLDERERHLGALPFEDAAACMRLLRAEPGIISLALQFTMLTGARTMMVLAATWREVDLEAREWAVPARRMKAKQTHVVPLSPQAMAILQALPRGSPGDLVFTDDRDIPRTRNLRARGLPLILDSNAMRLLLRRLWPELR